MSFLAKSSIASTIPDGVTVDFPRYTISIDYPPRGARYTATRKKPGPGPYLAITKDPLELREALPAGPHLRPTLRRSMVSAA